MDYLHKSVLFDECIENLKIIPDGCYFDGTLGGAGHSLGILQKLNDDGILIGVDRDEAAIVNAFKTLNGHLNKAMLVRGNFIDSVSILENLNIPSLDGVLLDLGISSNQVDDFDRGFSYMKDGELDMRMDKRSRLTAQTVVNQYDEEDIHRIIRDYGEEKWAKRIAEFIVKWRKEEPFTTTLRLVDCIKAAIPKAAREENQHPAKRTFQAIRIEVNDELGSLEAALNSFISLLNPGGRLCVITFHSLEDRIVKNTFLSHLNPCTCPRDLPVCVCNRKPDVKIITKKPILPTQHEIEENPRARSAKLRVLEKL